VIPVQDDYKPKRFPLATAGTIALLLAVLLAFPLALGDTGVYWYNLLALFPARFFHYASLSDPIEALTPLFSCVMHLTWLHLIGNCYFIHLFGPRVEDTAGRAPMVALVVLGGAVANLCAAAANPESAARIVGASGGASALMAFHILAFPNAKLVYAIPPIKNITAPAYLVPLALLALTVFWLVLSPESGVSHASHLSGLAIGAAAGTAYRLHTRISTATSG